MIGVQTVDYNKILMDNHKLTSQIKKLRKDLKNEKSKSSDYLSIITRQIEEKKDQQEVIERQRNKIHSLENSNEVAIEQLMGAGFMEIRDGYVEE